MSDLYSRDNSTSRPGNGTEASPSAHAPAPAEQALKYWTAILACCAAYAAYVGFRLPSLWSSTLYAVTIEDVGTVRRALFGTMMRPILSIGGHSYAGYAAAAFIVLAAIGAVVWRAALAASHESQRYLVCAWLLGPTGGYFFHEVGYLDQVLYLLLFLSIWAWGRRPGFVAVLPMIAAVLVHEAAALMVLPVFTWWVLRRPHATEARWLALPFASTIAVAAWPPLSDNRVMSATASVQQRVGFTVRTDAIELYGRTQLENWQLFNPVSGFGLALPMACAIAVFWIIQARCPIQVRDKTTAFGALLASLSPLLLNLAGWDSTRWLFLCCTNFSLVLFLHWNDQASEPRRSTLVGSLLVGAVALMLPFVYFDGYAPRSPSVKGIISTWQSPNFFDLPDM